jgi:hypothetical protein
MEEAAVVPVLKPFDVKVLGERLQAKGLDVAEELLKVLAAEVLDWTAESCAVHSNAFVKFGAPAIVAVKPIVMKELDKLDGEVG